MRKGVKKAALSDKKRRGLNGLPKGGFRWLASGTVASTNWIPWIPKRIQHAKIVIPQAFDNESLFPKSSGRWIPLGFLVESACRYLNAALRPPAYIRSRGGTMPRGDSNSALITDRKSVTFCFLSPGSSYETCERQCYSWKIQSEPVLNAGTETHPRCFF